MAVASAQPALRNIDLLRFLAASVVVLSHIGLQFPMPHVRGIAVPPNHYAFNSIMMILWNGPAAVMLFFVVSGICINMQYTHNRPLNVAEFYMRRYMRIGPPLLVAYVFATAVSGKWDFSALPVVWSLWCEAIYYLIYPLLLVLIARIGFNWVFLLSCIGCFALSLKADQGNGHAWNYGPLLTWIVFLPVWLAGLWISENAALAARLPGWLRGRSAAFMGGLAVFLLSILWTILRFHVHGGIKWPLYMILVFSAASAVFIFGLLQVDFSRSRVLRFLDRQGRWSYSLYLVHYPMLYLATLLMIRHFGLHGMTQRVVILCSVCVVAAAYALAYGFYQCVEAPAHRQAKQLGLKMRGAYGFTLRQPQAVSAPGE